MDKAKTAGLVPRARLRAFCQGKIRPFNGRVSAKALDIFSEELDKSLETAVESAWCQVHLQERQTIMDHDARKAIETTHALFAPDMLEALKFRLEKIAEEVLQIDRYRKHLFGKDAGQEAGQRQDAKLGES